MPTLPLLIDSTAAVVLFTVAVWLIRRALAERRMALRLGIWR